jgi:hypothetical protein
MTLKQKFEWQGSSAAHLASLQKAEEEMRSGKAQKFTYYMAVADAIYFALETFLEGDAERSKSAAATVVRVALEYFYGGWRETLPAPGGLPNPAHWRKTCLWYDEVMQSLPWACAIDDWEAVQKIAAYPIPESFPEAGKVKGEIAYGRALISFLRGDSAAVEAFLVKAEKDKAQRPKLLSPVIHALLRNDGEQYRASLLAYLEYYRTREFKRELDKLVALDGTTLYHIGRKRGLVVELPEKIGGHIIRFER